MVLCIQNRLKFPNKTWGVRLIWSCNDVVGGGNGQTMNNEICGMLRLLDGVSVFARVFTGYVTKSIKIQPYTLTDVSQRCIPSL